MSNLASSSTEVAHTNDEGHGMSGKTSKNRRRKTNPKPTKVFVSLKSKLRAIKLVEDGVNKSEVAQQFGVDRTTICHWLANKTKIEQQAVSKN